MSRSAEITLDPLKVIDEAGEHPEIWKPEEGDVIAGEIRRYDEIEHPEYGHSYICVIQDSPASVKSVFISPSVLRSEFAKKKPKVGEKISIRYAGKAGSTGRRYSKFTVNVPDRPPLQPNWDKVDADHGNYNESVKEESAPTPYASATVKGGTAVAERPAQAQPALVDEDDDPFREDN